MDLKFIDDNFIGDKEEREIFKAKFCEAVQNGDFDSKCPELYRFLRGYRKRSLNPTKEKKLLWYEAISDRVRSQNQRIVDECTEFAKKEKQKDLESQLLEFRRVLFRSTSRFSTIFEFGKIKDGTVCKKGENNRAIFLQRLTLLRLQKWRSHCGKL